MNCLPHLPQVLTLHGWELRAPQQARWLQYLNSLPDRLPDAFVNLAGPVIDFFVDGSCFYEAPFKVAAWAVVVANPPSLDVKATDFQVVASGCVPGSIQSSHRAELWALLAALHYGSSTGAFIRAWSDCQSVVDGFQLLAKGRKILRPNHLHFDLWDRIVQYVAVIGYDRVYVAKVPGHEHLDSAVDDLERWAYLGNAMADATAKSTNLARTPETWELWRSYVATATRLALVGSTVRSLMVQVSRRWKDRCHGSGCPMTSTSRPIKEGRVFPVKWSGAITVQSVGGVWHRRFHTLEQNFLQWWNVTFSSEQPRWISFVHLYVDWMMSFGHLGVLRLSKRWYDSEVEPGIAIEQYSFRLRVKHWRLCIQQFLKDVGIEAGTATCRPFSRSLQIFVGSISLPWPSHRLTVIDQWLEDQLGSVIRGKASILDRLCKPPCQLGLDP